MKRHLYLAVIPALLLALAATPALADEGQGQDVKAKIKKKMEKILELMKANEKALVELSVGKDAKPKRVDIDVPPPEGKAGGSSGASGSDGASGSSGSSGSSGMSGVEIRKKLEELMSGEGGGAIPKELKELVEMIPT